MSFRLFSVTSESESTGCRLVNRFKKTFPAARASLDGEGPRECGDLQRQGGAKKSFPASLGWVEGLSPFDHCDSLTGQC